eukprot:2223276-Amphidinium_carterae.2
MDDYKKLQPSHENRVCDGLLPEPQSTQPSKRLSTAYRPTWTITVSSTLLQNVYENYKKC